MRNQLGHSSLRILHLALVTSMVAILTPTIGASHVATAATVTPWAASGPGNFTEDSDGSLIPPQLTYNLGADPLGARFADQTWTLSTEAESDFTDNVPYFYTGYHAFFQVRVHLDAFVTRGGVTTTTSLVADGPVNCCTPPSGGFTYTGSHAFDVVADDT